MRQRNVVLTLLVGLGVWLAVVLLAVAANLIYTKLTAAQQVSTESMLSAPAVAGEDAVELSWVAATGPKRYELLAWTSVDALEQQDVDPVYITTLAPPQDGSQQEIVMPASVTVSEDDPWFGPFYALNDPDRSVSVDLIHEYGIATAIRPREGLCSLPHYIDSSFAAGYQTVAREGFYVRRCPGFEHLTSISLTVTTYPDNRAYTVHHIRVYSDGDPAPTTSAPRATTAATPTATPSAITLSAPQLTAIAGDDSVELSWDSVTGALRYELWVWTSAGGWKQIGGENLTGTTYRHTELAAGTTNHYAARAVFPEDVTGPWSEHASASDAAPQPSSAAPALAAAASEGAIVLNWTSLTGALRYELFAWTHPGGWQQIGGDNLTGTTYTHTGLAAGTPYFYAVRAVHAGGVAGPLSQSSLAAPALTAVDGEGGAVELNWTPVTAALRYELWIRTNASSWQQIGGDNLTGTTYTHTQLAAGTTYYYAVRAVHAGGVTSPWSENASATVAAP